MLKLAGIFYRGFSFNAVLVVIEEKTLFYQLRLTYE